MKGKNNEDRFGVTAFRSRAMPNVPILLAVLSDGIGGNRAGEIASELAVNMISQFVANSDGRNPQAILEAAIHFASGRIFKQAQENVEQQGMGATCACAWIAGDRLYTATIGDSRIYLMRGNMIHQLSIDHTWIQEALERGLIEPEEASGHPNAHVIRRYLGSPAPPEVDFRMQPMPVERDPNDTAPAPVGQGMRLLPGDRVLLCSDGLTDLVSDEEILAAFRESSLDEAGHQLVNLANERGGHDNITLIAVQMPDATSAAPKAQPALPARLRALVIGCLGVIALAALVGAVAGGYLLFGENEQATATPTPGITMTATITGTATRTPRATRTPINSPTPFATQVTRTPTQPAGPQPTVTAWPTNTPGLPIVSSTPGG